MDPYLKSVHIVGDASSGVVRGIGVLNSAEATAAINSDAIFAEFNEQISPLLSGDPQRVTLDLMHVWTRKPLRLTRQLEA